MLRAAAVALLLCVAVGRAQQTSLATTPPMGWNSWDSYGLSITESQFLANVDVLARKLKPSGWRYAVIDEGWYLQNPASAAEPETLRYTINAAGQYAPAMNRFPSAADGVGLRYIGDIVHAGGLLFGIHIIRGIPKQTVAANTLIEQTSFHAAEAADQTDLCPWNPDNYGVNDNAAGQAWYDGLLRQYASWGVDYLKVDCIASHPYKAAEIAMIHRAIVKSGRPIVLSLSPGPTSPGNAAEVASYAQLWRISDDVWDVWSRPATDPTHFPQTVKGQFAVVAGWSKYVAPGSWPDADMLPLGQLTPVPGYGAPRLTRLSHEEQRTLLTLWAIARSPLFMGGNLTQLDDFTTALLTNSEVIALDQQGRDQRFVSQEGDLVAWTAKDNRGGQYLALFNLGDRAAGIRSPFSHYGLMDGSYNTRDLWARTSRGKQTGVATDLAPHGSLLLQLKPELR